MKNFIIPLTILMAVSCGKKHENSNTQTELSTQPSLERPTNSPDDSNESSTSAELPLVQEAKNILYDILENRIDARGGLRKISKLLNVDLDETQPADRSENKLVSDEIESLANLLLQVGGNLDENISILLGLESIADNLKGEHEVERVNSLYEILQNTEMTYSENIDQLLIHYLVLKINLIDSQVSERDAFVSVFDYYQYRFDSLLIDKKMSTTKLFHTYNMMFNLFPVKTNRYFSERISEILIFEHNSKMSHELYQRLIEYTLYQQPQNLKLNGNIQGSLYNNLKWFISYSISFPEQLVEGLEVIGNYLSYIDYISAHSLDNSQYDYYRLLDQRSVDLVKEIENLGVLLDSKRELLSNKRNSVHPYLKLLIDRTLINHNKELIFYGETYDEEVFLEDFYAQMPLLDSKKKNKATKYLKHFYNVEAYKFHLLSQKSLETTDKKRTYNNAFNNLVYALNIRFDEKLDPISLRTKNENHKLVRYLVNENGKLNQDIFYKNYCRVDGPCEENKFFTPGIYMATTGQSNFYRIELHGKKISMHPLAMIYAPGKDVSLNFLEMGSVWIDTSGLNAQRKNKDSSEVIAIHPDITCVEKGSLQEGKSYSHICGLNQNDTIILKNNKNIEKSYSGTNGGDIKIHLSYKGQVSLSSLLIANGGNGAKGYDAPKIINKKSRIKQSRNKSKTITNSGCFSKLRYENYWYYYYQPAGSRGYNPQAQVNEHTEVRYLSYNKIRGGDGGDAGAHGKISFVTTQKNFPFKLYIDGKPGKGGAPSKCGQGKASTYRGKKGKIIKRS